MATRSRTTSPTVRSRRRASPGAGTTLANVRYVESSALLTALLEGDARLLRALRTRERLVTSALTFAEAARAVIRAREAGRLTQAEEQRVARALRTFERRCFIVEVTRDVLARAGRRFPVEPVRTLDAIHLATLELLGEPAALVTVLTRDRRVHENAAVMGYVVV